MADRADLARELLRLAGDDLTAAQALVDVPSVTDDIVGFHAQQAAEKALKAVLARGRPGLPVHAHIAVLTQLCEDAHLVLPLALDKVDLLTPFSVAARYGTRSAGAVDRATALTLATSAVAWARAVVES